MTRHTLTVEIETDDSVWPFDPKTVSSGLGTLLHEFYGTDSPELGGYEEGHATIDRVFVNGVEIGSQGEVVRPGDEPSHWRN